MSLLITISIFILVLTLVMLIYLTFTGKTVLDRVLTLDLIAITAIGCFLMFYLLSKIRFYLDIGLLMALVGFVVALVFALFIPRIEE